MARNIEIKARVTSLAAVERRLQPLATAGPQPIEQDDQFFASPRGRLKLRRFGDGSAELIFYRRPDAPGPRLSEHLHSACPDADALAALLTAACGALGRVRKHRRVYWCGRTRVHLDTVEGLGEFVELEVVLADGEPEAAGIAEATELMRALGIATDALVDTAYVDLLDAPSA